MTTRSVGRVSDRLTRLIPDKITADKPLAKNTTLRVGGPAAIFATADTLHDLHIIIGAAAEYELPLLLLGRGSNLLIADSGFPGLVLQLGREFQQLSFIGSDLLCGAAVPLPTLVQSAFKHELRGLSWAIGIPGTVGAAVAINAGAYGGDMSAVVRQITVYTPDCRLRSLNQEEIGFGYRHTKLEPGTIILEAKMSLKTGRSEQLRSEMEINFRRRKESQPFGLPSAGSIFKNPPDDYAGRLIEAAGCKGWKEGGAEVSDKHANYIINRADATAGDIYRLLNRVRAAVEEKFGISLEPEVRIVGEFEEG